MISEYDLAGIGRVSKESGLVPLSVSSDGFSQTGKNGIRSITATGDGKVEFIDNGECVLAYVKSALGYPAYYPLHAARINKPIKAVLMDLDGTSVRSEDFWMWIIQLSMADLLGDPEFHLEDEDVPYISGHSVSEHLQYCIDKYCADLSLQDAWQFYRENTTRELSEISHGRGRQDAFSPTEGLADFLLELKGMGAKIALVTSGLYEKAWPEVLSAFSALKLGDPREFYDSIITAGFQPARGIVGTLGELEPKPHPWLYAEAARVGLGMDVKDRHQVVGIEDSGAGVSSIRLAGFAAIGIQGGNILESGTRELCSHYCHSFHEILNILK